tara:strand:+ start:264 stop:530 length:267 start_codon:yes stop_codon:yes gene_type:complete
MNEQISAHQRIKAASMMERLKTAANTCIKDKGDAPQYLWLTAYCAFQKMSHEIGDAMNKEAYELQIKIASAEIALEEFDEYQAEKAAA